MSRTGVITMPEPAPVAAIPRKQNVLVVETDTLGNFIRGKQNVKVDKFPKEDVEFVLSLTEELSCPSSLRQCHCIFKTGCNCHTPGRAKKMIYFKIDLRFENYLHEFSQDYKYRITCNITSRLGKPMQMCSFEETRTTKSMTLYIDSDHQTDCIVKELCGAMISVDIERFCITPNFTHNKFQSDFKSLLDSQELSDMKLTVDKEIFKVHRCVLGCRSQVFKTMFNVEMKEKKDKNVDIIDVKPIVMKELLLYMYTGRCENLDKMPYELFEAAAKYQMDDLKSECIEYLIFHVKPENILELHQLVGLYNVEHLSNKISAFMNKYKRVVRN